MSLHVIGAGFGRTGTNSLKVALERLGFAPCYSPGNPIAGFRPWEAAVRTRQRGEPIDWDQILLGARAVVHWPGIFFWRELVAAYPEAKVVLAVRGPERWYESMSRTVYRLTGPAAGSPRAEGPDAPPLQATGAVAAAMPFLRQEVWDRVFGGRFSDKEHAIRVFTERNEAIKAVVPPDHLLVYEVKAGWDPLCQFLGVNVPAGESFPHVNDAASVQRRFRVLSGD